MGAGMSDTTTQFWMVLGAAFGASILTTIGTRWIAGFQAKATASLEAERLNNERERDRLADERRIREERRDRLREDYVRVVQASMTMQEVADDLLFLDGQELQTERFRGLDRLLGEAKADLDRSVVRLMLESEAQPV